MKPKDVVVNLTFGGQATISIFDLEIMILSLLNDSSLMQPKNLAQGYDVFTGKSIGRQDCYGEIHTGDAWEPACQLFCGDDIWNVPIALVLFGDKSHLDLHGSLSTLPIIFTLSCFNKESRNKAEFWHPLAFLPNLSYGALSSKNFKKPSHHSYQDKHDCLKVTFSDLQRIHKQGGLSLIVMGKPVIVKVWIHYCVGDTQGNSRCIGHYNGSGNLNHPFRDCKCACGIWTNQTPIVSI